MTSLTYEQRLRLPLTGDPSRKFFTKTGQLVATGYDRVVIGGRGPYVEFETSHMVQDNLVESKTRHHYYVELRTTIDDVKVYMQVRRVEYADYVPGRCYASPFELYDDTGAVLIERL